jgi:2'-5' RNA ligase
MRLFVAVELPEPVRRALTRVQETLRASLGRGGVSWTKPDNLHLTLKFIGEWPEQRVAELCESLSRVSVPEMQLSLGDAGPLPPRGPARVLVVDLLGEVQQLLELARQVEERCHEAGVPREARSYMPHATLARLRPPRRIDADLLAAATPKLPQEFTVDRFVVMQSQLSPQGSTYTPIATFGLGGDQEVR